MNGKGSDKNEKKVLLVSHEMTYTGAPRSLLKIAGILRDSGYKVVVWTFLEGVFIKEFLKNGFNVSKINFPIEASEKMAKSLKEFEFVIANTIFTSSFACYAQHFVQTVLYIREAQNIPQLIKDCGLNEADLGNIQHMVCVSEYAEKYILEKYQPLELRTIHNFVEETSGKETVCVQEKSNSHINILVLGTIEPRKGQKVAIEAFMLLSEDLRKYSRLHIVGSVPEWAEKYWEEIKEYFSEQIIYHGEIQENEKLQKLYEDMDIVIIPSLDEACSLVALEAAMYGKAILVTENVGAKYIVDSSCIVKTNDSYALYKKMKELISTPKLLLELGQRNRRFYQQSSTKNHYKIELLNYIKNLERIEIKEYIKVSIVVPVYNVENYLERCMDSLIGQTLTEIEIICVNDGSTDDSLNILSKYQENDIRVKVLSIENSGYGHSLNVGMAVALGEYVGIVVPEDYVDKRMYEFLYHQAIANDKDVIIGGVSNEDIHKEKCKYIGDSFSDGFIRSGIVRRSFLLEKKIMAEENRKIRFIDNFLWECIFSYQPTVMRVKKTVYKMQLSSNRSYYYQDVYGMDGIFYKYRLNEVLNSKSYKIGRIITSIPRSARNLISYIRGRLSAKNFSFWWQSYK